MGRSNRVSADHTIKIEQKILIKEFYTMAITAEQRKEVISLLVGMFDAAPSAELLTGFVASIENGQSLESLANDLAATDEFASLYPVWLTNDEFATNFVTNILDGNTSAAALAEGIATVTAMLNGGSTRGEAANQAVALLTAVPVTDTIWGQAAQGLANKVDVATYFATTKLTAASEFDALRAVVADVDATATSVSDQKILIDAGVDSLAQNLTAGQDFLEGSSGNDAFTAWIFDNQNTAQSGDSIKGGAGTDTLLAEIGNSQKFAISMKTDSVEVAHFRAQAASTDANGDNDVTDSGSESIDKQSQVDAQDMNGTVEFWSTDSRANLTIEDIQTNSHQTTIGWRNSDAGNVNYEVYFDNITKPGATTAGSQLFLEVLDLQGMETDGEPLKDNPYVGVQFTMDGVVQTVAADVPVQTTYADLVAGINAELIELGLTTVTASLGSAFSAINSDTGVAYQGTTVVLTNTGPEILAGEGWIVDGILPPDSNVHTKISNVAPATSVELTATDVVFDYVGSGSKSADFVAGEMSQSGGSIDSGSAGIQQFNIDVDRTSWLDEVRSTNNTLEEVNVESIGAAGALRVDVLKDVQTFNAASMTNNVTLGATLDDTVIAKYFNKKDTDADEGADNVNFNYTGGSANDNFTLTVSEEAASFEDFVLNVSTGTGNDAVTLKVNNMDGDLNTNWQADQAALNNIVVSTGAGNDTVNTFGAGEATISTGSGNDTVYSDNSGIDNQQATWVFNASNTDKNDLLGKGNGAFFLQDAKLSVTFSAGSTGAGVTAADAMPSGIAALDMNGFTSVVTVPTTNGVARSADIAQAIKDAINNDAVLSKLLKAEDGPNHSLVVTSLIDGVYQVGDLDVSVQPTTTAALTAATSLTTATTNFQTMLANSGTPLNDAALNTQANNAAVSFTGVDSYTGAGVVGATAASQVLMTGYANEDVFTVVVGGVNETGGDTTLTFDGFTGAVNAAATTPAAAATAFVTAYNAQAASATNYTAVDNTGGSITFTAKVAGTGSDAIIVTGGDYTVTPTHVALTGVASDEGKNDNVINVGTGDDVIVLSTDANSDEVITYTDTTFGVDTIVNFEAGVGGDQLNFQQFLSDIASGSGSTASQARVLTTLSTGLVGATDGTNALVSNEVIVITDFTATATQTFAALTGVELLAAINDSNTGTSNYGDIGENTLDASTAALTTNLVGTVRNHIVLIENEANDGEYKVFHLTSNNVNTTDDFTAATLLGTVDLGETTVFNVANFS